MSKMESSEVTIARKQLKALKQEHEDLNKIRTIQLGHVRPGEEPALLARAIRDFIPLPLKYTQSLESLQSLYNYSLETKDTKLYQWTCQQIRTTHKRDIFNAIQKSAKLPAPTPLETTLKKFRKSHKTMTIPEYMLFLTSKKATIPPFFFRQMERVAQFNAERSKITNENLQNSLVKSCADTLSIAFLKQDMMKKTSSQYAPNICNLYKINPYVSVSILVDTHGPRVGFHEIITNEILRKKGLFSKETLTIPKDLLLTKLKKYNVPDYYIDQIEKLFK